MYIDLFDFCMIFFTGFLFAIIGYGVYLFIDTFIFKAFNKEGLKLIGGYTLLSVGIFGHYGVLLMLAIYMVYVFCMFIYICFDDFRNKLHKNKCTF